MTNMLYLAVVRLPTEKAHGMQIMKTCEAFAENGARVELVIPGRKTGIVEDPFSYYGVKRNFTLTSLNTPDWVRFGMVGFLTTLFWFSEAVKWRKNFWTVDVVYSRDALVLLNYVLLGRKVMYEAHARPSMVSRFVAKNAYRVVAITTALKDAYVAAGVPESTITVAPDAVDVMRFQIAETKKEARERLTLPEHAPVILYTGHLYQRKGAATLAGAANMLPDALMVFVGGTPEDVAQFKVRWGSAPNIRIVGHVNPERIPLYLRAADVVVLPNSALDEDSARFASPMKLFEYMASGTPIIATDVPALREILDDDSAYFVTPDDAPSLAQGITRILADEFKALEKSKRAHTLAQKYSWTERAKRIMSAARS